MIFDKDHRHVMELPPDFTHIFNQDEGMIAHVAREMSRQSLILDTSRVLHSQQFLFVVFRRGFLQEQRRERA
jgi:hypothetical protein